MNRAAAPSRLAILAGSAIVLGALVAAVVRVALAARGTDLFADDAYYYLVIAKHLAASGRTTFDGVTLTNGFHPLLLLLEAGLISIVGVQAGPATLYVTVVTLVTALFTGTVFATVHTVWRLREHSGFRHEQALAITGLVAAVLYLPRLTSVYLSGMESVLVLPLLVALGFATARGRWGLAGGLGALLALARLDTFPFLLSPLIALCGAHEHRAGRSASRMALAMGLPALCVVASVVALDLQFFGHAQPISAALKSTFPRVNFQPENLLGNTEERLGLRLSVLGALTALALAAWPRVGIGLRRASIASAILALIQVANLVFFQAWTKSTPSWYLASALPLGVFAGVAAVADRLPVRLALRLTLAFVVLAVATNGAWFAGHAGRLGTPTAARLPYAAGSAEDSSASPSLLRWVTTRPVSTTFAASDCGALAWWSERRFVNLDGLVNDFQFQDALSAGRLREYLLAQHVRYLLISAWDGPQTPGGRNDEPMYRHRIAPALFSGDYPSADYFLYSYLHGATSDTLRLPPSAEVWRSTSEPDGHVLARHVVFDLYQTTLH